MAPNMKAMERLVIFYRFYWASLVYIFYFLFFRRLDDVEMKLVDTEKEADKARKDSKFAQDHFNDVKMRRFVF